MSKAVATFQSTKTFVVTGSSYNMLRAYFPFKSTRGVLIDDSGPVLDDEALAPCLQRSGGGRGT